MRDSMPFLISIFAAVTLWSGSSGAQQPTALEEDLVSCYAIPGSFRRLDCYDSALRRHNLIAPETDEVATGDWKIEQRSSGISDEADVYMVVHAVEKIPGDDGDVRPLLIVRCEENDTAVIFNFARFIEQSRADAAIRIDDGAVMTVRLKMSASGRAFGFWHGEEAVPFVKRLMDGRRLLVQVQPLGARPVVAEFAVAGLDTAVGPLREACGW